ncbi:MAG TPA: hypothetical protein VF761_16645 [Gemmatimonadaceae bacterium]
MDNTTGNTGAEGAVAGNTGTTFRIPGTVEVTSPNTFSIGTPGNGPTMSLDGTPVDFSLFDARLFALRELKDYTAHLVGGLLTIMEAVVTDAKQLTAVKSLVKREVWEAHYEEALRWAQRQAEIEFKALAAWDAYRSTEEASRSASGGPHPVAPQSWADVVTDRFIGVNAAWNVFPFSRNGAPAPIDERFPDAVSR